jgi:hypothetical protein
MSGWAGGTQRNGAERNSDAAQANHVMLTNGKIILDDGETRRFRLLTMVHTVEYERRSIL